MGAYGVLPGGTAPVVDTSHSVLDATLWRSHYIDPTGFYYLGARYYDPSSGRFLSPDPLGHDSSPGLYDYTDGDPVNGLDADGRFDTAHSLSTYSSPTMSTTKQILSALNGREISLRQTVSDPVPQLEVKGIVDHPTLNDPENEQRQELSDLVSYVPLLAQVQDFVEMSSGRNPFTGRYLSEAEQIGAGVNFLVGALTLGEGGALARVEMSFVEREVIGGLESRLYSTIGGGSMDSSLFSRIQTAFQRTPGRTMASDAESELHLGPDPRIEGETLSKNVIALRINPSTSSVYEELIHTAQLRRGMDPITQGTQMEIEAAQKLIKFADRYKIPKAETKATIQRLNKLLKKSGRK